MSRPNPARLFGFLALSLAALGGAAIAKDGLFVGKHEGDMLHLMEILFRMEAGQWPHIDFVTPIGALAFAPIVLFLEQGMGVGRAIVWGQVLVGAALLPAAWWVGVSRLPRAMAYIFGLIILVLATALTYGEAERSISLSMHYNRWAWAVAFIAIALAVLPPRGTERRGVDGVVIGLAMAALVLIKATYFAAFLIPVALALVLRRAFGTLIAALLAGLAVAALVTAVAGVEFWLAYLGDLLTVSRSEVRSFPGEPLIAVVGAPAYVGGSLLLLAGVIFLRQGGEALGGLILLLLAPGFVYVSFQNYGNDPQWLMLLAVMAITLRPAAPTPNAYGWDMRQMLTIVGAMAFALMAASFFNMAYSPFRHLVTPVAEYAPLLPKSERHADFQTRNLRANRIDANIALHERIAGLEGYADLGERPEIGTLFGEPLQRCEISLGTVGWFDAIASDLAATGLANGKQIFTADLFSSFWLYGPFEPLKGGSPWYYGGLPGFENADLILVPLCPVLMDVRRQILDAIGETGTELIEIRRTPLYVLYEKA